MTTQTQTRDSFIFYRSFYDASKCLKTNEKAQLFDAICSYALDEKIKQLDGAALGMFQLIKPQLDANRKKFQNGCVKKQNETEAKPKQNESKTEANVNVNENVNEECKSESINHNQNINDDFKEFWENYPLQKAKVKGSKRNSLKEYESQRKKGITKEELNNALTNYKEEIKANPWQQSRKVDGWLKDWETYKQEDYSKQIEAISQRLKAIEPLASIQEKDKKIIINIPTFISYQANKNSIENDIKQLCKDIGFQYSFTNKQTQHD